MLPGSLKIAFAPSFRRAVLALMTAALLGGCTFNLNPYNLPVTPIHLPGSTGKITFGELLYDERLGKVLVPAGETGNLNLIDPETLEVTTITGFSTQASGEGGAGAISAASGRNHLFVLDQGARKLMVVDPVAGRIIASTPVMGIPETVRYIAATNQLWVTEPDLGQIEVFSIPDTDPLAPVHRSVILVPDGPKGLVFDRARGLAYTNQPNIGLTAVIQVQTQGIIAHWGNGCSEAAGMVLDEEEGLLFVACGEGKLAVLDIQNGGSQVTNQTFGADLKSIGYNRDLKHVYVPSGASAILAIFAITEAGAHGGLGTYQASETATPTPGTAPTLALVRLGTADTALQANCTATDNHHNVWVCDPTHGRIFLIKDTFPAVVD